ncbi:MAG: c-type cytochrome [Anaerolineae bacterium]|nr:c-type cytochrome [Anaerolineae bacterium]
MASFRRVNHKHTLTLLFSFLIIILAAACQGLAGEPRVVATLPPRATSTPLVAPQQAPDLALGAQIYAEKCTRCHGATGRGDGEFVLSGQIPSIVDFTDPATIEGQTPEDYFRIVTEGNLAALMPPWADELNDMQRWSVANYVYLLSSSEPPQVAQAQLTAEPGATAQVQTTEEPQPAQVQTTEEPTATGVVIGQLSNGTAGASIPEGQLIRLFSVTEQFESDVFETTANTDGSYQFEDVPLRPDRQYVLTAEYQGIRYMSDFASVEAGAAELTLPITIYETGADASAIQIDGLLNQIIVIEGELQLVQVISYTNTSDRAFVDTTDSGPRSVTVSVPTGAIYQNFTNSDYVLSADGAEVYDTQPVLPGEAHLMHVAFGMPYPTAEARIAQTIPYALAGHYEVLVATEGLTVTGESLVEQGLRQVGNSTMLSYAAELTTPANSTLTFNISGTPIATTSSQTGTPVTSDNLLSYILIVVGVLAIGLAGFLFWRDRKLQARAPIIIATAESQTLIEQIADLDRQHQEGKITRKVYERKRAELKAKLAKLMRDNTL